MKRNPRKHIILLRVLQRQIKLIMRKAHAQKKLEYQQNIDSTILPLRVLFCVCVIIFYNWLQAPQGGSNKIRDIYRR